MLHLMLAAALHAPPKATPLRFHSQATVHVSAAPIWDFVPSDPYMVATNFCAPGFQCDASGNLKVVSVGGSSVNFPYNGTGSEVLQNNGMVEVGTSDGGVGGPVSPFTNDGTTGKNANMNIANQTLGALTAKLTTGASGAWKYSILDFSGATTPQTVKSIAGTIKELDWVCTSAMTSTTFVELWDNTTNSGNKPFTATFLAGGFKDFGTPGLALTTGLTVDVNAVTTQSGCKFMVLWI